MFFNIVEFYNCTKDDIDCPEDYLIEFCRLYDVDFLKNLYQEVNGKTAPLSKIDWANEWISKQFRLYEYTDSQNIEEIIKIINPQDAFDLAAVLFTYENNWNTLNQSRMWTINELPNTIEESKKFLISNAHNYTFFKD